MASSQCLAPACRVAGQGVGARPAGRGLEGTACLALRGGRAARKVGEFTEPDPGLPNPAAELEARVEAQAPLPLHPATLMDPPVPSPRGRGAGSWQLPIPPVASPAVPVRPVVCPNDRLALVSQGTQPRVCACTWRRAGRPTQGRHHGHWPGSHRKRAPRQTRHLAPGLVTARHSASGRRPQKCVRLSAFCSAPCSPQGDNLGTPH